MFQHRMIVGKIQAAADGRKYRPQGGAVELQTGAAFLQLQAIKAAHEIIVPKGTAVFAVRYGF